MLEANKGAFLEKPSDYVQCLIDNLPWLHFTACHTGAIVSQKLTARRASFTRKREATKQSEELRAEMLKLAKKWTS